MPAWIEYFAVAVCAISAVLAAEGKGVDLFGVLVLAVVTALGEAPSGTSAWGPGRCFGLSSRCICGLR